jgi:hypothetical protein
MALRPVKASADLARTRATTSARLPRSVSPPARKNRAKATGSTWNNGRHSAFKTGGRSWILIDHCVRHGGNSPGTLASGTVRCLSQAALITIVPAVDNMPAPAPGVN